jgi:hypothetical protein
MFYPHINVDKLTKKKILYIFSNVLYIFSKTFQKIQNKQLFKGGIVGS